MSNPRYVPRNFALHPRDFGQKPMIEWNSDSAWSTRERAQAEAAQIQHAVAYGVLNLYMPRSPTRRMTTLAAALDLPYPRLQKLLTGNSVMQLEDLGRIRNLIGDNVDLWLLRGRHATLLAEGHQALAREAERGSIAQRMNVGPLAPGPRPPMR